MEKRGYTKTKDETTRYRDAPATRTGAYDVGHGAWGVRHRRGEEQERWPGAREEEGNHGDRLRREVTGHLTLPTTYTLRLLGTPRAL